ncbi:hypothetical protein IFM89_028575 [Coptis chinensis]|uniref:Embryogenesis-associated protein EMB8 n=1 Tax=Coptis chinensis TaxID=261450 RepID=A0A835IFC0_9MAGN|nr:hypothetical protein IFM89_028575 [Coptis chinensis]
MLSTPNYTNVHLQSPLYTSRTHDFRIRKQRRLIFISCQFGPFENISFPSLNSLQLIIPPLSLASGVTLYLSSRNKPKRNPDIYDLGEWILFTSPTPFNRFVFLRCPSIKFKGSELLEDLNEKLVKEDRHFISGRIQGKDGKVESFEEKLVYQRICLGTSDGGVISLDWPRNLDLREEHGMDTTVVLVPGTAEGSMDKNLRLFVCELLKRGCFPIVMNPRGCAGSPLTTPRLFTAADSNDICTAIQFINKARPWNTLMAVGWGNGANMVTKYLAEVEERTPLTAATCIDNPFDLEEATRSFPYHVAVDQKLTSGLIDILRSSKELFQGRAKGFNVEKALSATSLRDFEREISMVAYGFKTIEEFYSKSSTRELVGNVKIPVLFIQACIFDSSISVMDYPSVPGLPALRCPYGDMYAEWLSAVELGLLKGRHPLLKDVDVAINPSVNVSLVESRALTTNSRVDKLLNLTEMDALNGYPVDSAKDMVNRNEITNINLGSQRNSSVDSKSQGGKSELMEQNSSVGAALVEESGENSGDSERSQVHNSSVDAALVEESGENSGDSERSQVQNSSVDAALVEESGENSGDSERRQVQNSSVDAALVKESGENSGDSERSQVLQSAHVVMNMLDVSMPGTLDEEQKKKVLHAMERGETLMKALQGALPEDVRGKLTTSVSEIVKTQGTNLNLDRIMNMTLVPNVSSEVKSKIQDTVKELSSATGGFDHVPSLEPIKLGDEMSGSAQSVEEKPPVDLESDTQPSDLVIGEEERLDNDMTQTSKNEANGTQMNEETNIDVSDDDKKSRSTTETEESLPPATSSPDPRLIDEESNHSQKDGSENVHPVVDQNEQGHTKSEEPTPSIPPASNPPSFNVTQALDALTGMDDSTQMAVNSVFGVLENMIAKMEEESGQEIDEKQDKSKDGEPSSAYKESHIGSQSEDLTRSKENFKGDSRLESDLLQYSNLGDEDSDNVVGVHRNAHNDGDEKQLTKSSSTSSEKNTGSIHGSGLTGHIDKETYRRINEVTDSKLSVEQSGLDGHISKLPLHVTVNPYGDSMYNEHLRRYLLTKIPNTKSLDLDSTTDLLLDYFPEEGQWKLLDQTGSNGYSNRNVGNNRNINGSRRIIRSPPRVSDTNEIIETSYVVLDTEKEQQPIEEYKTAEEEPMVQSVKNIILDSLKVEVGRRLGLPDMKKIESNLALDLEHVAEVVSLAVGDSKELTWFSENRPASGEVVPLHGEYIDIAQTITSAVNDTTYLRKVLPVGVVVGSSLSALRKYIIVATQNDYGYGRDTIGDHAKNVAEKFNGQVSETGNDNKLVSREQQHSSTESSVKAMEKLEAEDNENVMAGAVTAALGASAFFLHQQSKDPYNRDEVADVSSRPLNENRNHLEEHESILDANNESQSVSSLAEKAMSVAAPVVPTKSDGGVDQDRLVAILSDLGQKGGMLRMIGKLALLWGVVGQYMFRNRVTYDFGIPGSLETHILETIILLGFVCMVLVLWSPVVIPLFPTLVQGWATHNSTGIAEYACIIGLYTAVTILIIIWGKRIRGYEDSLEQYGLNLTSAGKLLDFLKGLVGGVMLVLAIHSINALLGCSNFSWSLGLSSSSLVSMASLKACGRFLVLAGRGIVTATIVVIVEEILFRSWLPQEIAVDFGYNWAVIISGFAFSICQRSLRSIPGLWLLSIALCGLRQRGEGSLSIPIGMRAGILSSSFVLQTSGFLIYHSNYPLWLAGANPLQPFDGAVVEHQFSIVQSNLLYQNEQMRGSFTPRQRKHSFRLAQFLVPFFESITEQVIPEDLLTMHSEIEGSNDMSSESDPFLAPTYESEDITDDIEVNAQGEPINVVSGPVNAPSEADLNESHTVSDAVNVRLLDENMPLTTTLPSSCGENVEGGNATGSPQGFGNKALRSLRLNQWSPKSSGDKQFQSHALVWVRFPGHSLKYWEVKNLLPMERAYGRPTHVDGTTAKSFNGVLCNYLDG